MWARQNERYEGYGSIILSEDVNIIDNGKRVHGTRLLIQDVYIKYSLLH